MALVPSYNHDVFVSYAHADNTLSFGSEAALGWVTALVQNLNRGPNVAAKEIFIDHQLQPGDAFSEYLLKKVERSALLLILLSQNYLKSKWCGQEIAHFIRTHADNPEQPRDVFVVELWPFERLKDIPSAIENLRKHLIHAKCWFQPAADAMPRRAGIPFAVLRAIVDPQTTAIPGAALAAIDELGRPRIASLLLALARNPRDLVGLLRLSACFRAALGSLKRAAGIAGLSISRGE